MASPWVRGWMILVACGACGSSVADSSNELFDELCDTAFRCCSRGEVDTLLGPFVDEDNCNDRLRHIARVNTGVLLYGLPMEGFGFVLPNIQLLERAVDEGRAELNDGAVGACVDALREIPCNDPEPEPEPEGCLPEEPVVPEACDVELLIQGNVGEGGDCTSTDPSFECAEGMRCARISSLGNEGVCVRPGEAGDFCYEDVECEEEHFCNILDGLCEVLRDEGQPCEFVDPDAINPDPRPLSQGGDVVIPCLDHLSCDPVLDVCVPGCVQGAPCSEDADCNPDGGLQCIVVSGRGRCDFRREQDQPCSSDDNCLDGLFCGQNPANPSEAVCLALLDDSASCFRDEQCGSGYCQDNSQEDDTCEPQVADGMPCPSRDDTQCLSGFCEVRNVTEIMQANQFPFGSCSGDIDCPGASTCDLNRFQCVELCRARAADGVSCGLNQECLSENCVVDPFLGGQCQTIPLMDDQICSNDFQCASEFCNPISQICQTLPLDDGDSCSSNNVCKSEVCDGGRCVFGLPEGADCTLEPCARGLFCDGTTTPRRCVLKLEPGQLCSSSSQCHGTCRQIFGRFRCDVTSPTDEAICDGAPAEAEE